MLTKNKQTRTRTLRNDVQTSPVEVADFSLGAGSRLQSLIAKSQSMQNQSRVSVWAVFAVSGPGGGGEGEMTKPWEPAWKVRDNISGGGQGITYLVEDNIGRLGVLKTLAPTKKKLSQARAQMRVEVTNLDVLAKQGMKVPCVYQQNTEAYDNLDVELYFVMEYIPGKTLRKEVQERGPLTVDKAVAITEKICSIVAGAHQLDILHRDLKPDNIVVRSFEENDLVIVDYGLSFNHAADHADSLTCADEQFRSTFLALPEANTPGGDRRDKRSDLTAICAIFFFCLTKHEPGQLRDDRGRAIHRSERCSVKFVLGEDLRRRQVEAFLDVGLAYEMDNRFQACSELTERLGGVLSTRAHEKINLAEAAARFGKELQQFDRKTQLKEESDRSVLILQAMADALKPYGGKKLHPFYVGLSQNPVSKPMPQGLDLVTPGFTFTVKHDLYGLLWIIQFAIGSKGPQYVLLRGIFRQLESRLDTSSEWDPLHWYTSESRPDPAELVPFVEQSIYSAMQELQETILGAPQKK